MAHFLMFMLATCGVWASTMFPSPPFHDTSSIHASVPETSREFFYIGGKYENATVGAATGQFMTGQIYVEKLTPPNPTDSHQIVFITGAGQTATNFLQTPDGREGWASYFLRHGYTVYLTDQPSRGRSFFLPDGKQNQTAFPTRQIESSFTATQDFNLWPGAELLTQWPGSGRVGDPVFDAFYASQINFQSNGDLSEAQNRDAYAALLDRIGAAFLVTHSQSGAYGWQIANARPELVKGIVALEPSGPPFVNVFPVGTGRPRTWGITNLAIDYDPPAGPNGELLQTVTVEAVDDKHIECLLQTEPAKQLTKLAEIPVLVVTSESGYHAQHDYCTVAYMRQAGVEVEHLELGKAGLHGNGHFMFMELNNFEIAQRVEEWLKKV